MLLENMKIARILMHEVFQRAPNRDIVPPAYADALENLPQDATDAFRLRVTEALSAKAKSLEMDIIKTNIGSHVHSAQNLIQIEDHNEFLHESRAIADALTSAQMGRDLPGGMLIVFDGTVGAQSSPFLGVIKAETQSGFRRRREKKSVITEFLDNIFLTPATRLYKIGLMVQADASKPLPKGWKAFVFDSNISLSHRESAAQYFYEGFLGCAFPKDGAYETARFFDLTKEFIKKTDLPTEKKRDLYDALYTFIKTDKEKTFTSDEFGESYLPDGMRDPFNQFLQGRNFPDRAIERNVSEMGNRLKRRKFHFGPDIEFSASPEALEQNKATIKSGPANQFGGEGKDTWTQITIKQNMTDER